LRPLTNSLRGFVRRPPDERAVALRALFAVVGVKRRLRREGYKNTLASLSDRVGSPVAAADARRLAMAADAAMKRWPVNVTCLERSLVVWWILGGGSDLVIRFGVARSQDQPKFHAWIEQNGSIVNDELNITDHYAPFGPGVPTGSFD